MNRKLLVCASVVRGRRGASYLQARTRAAGRDRARYKKRCDDEGQLVAAYMEWFVVKEKEEKQEKEEDEAKKSNKLRYYTSILSETWHFDVHTAHT